jgi:hypothetical protein
MDYTVRVGEEEIGRILNLRENLDQRELLVACAGRYQRLGWVLAAVTASGELADLDFSQPQAVWAEKLRSLDLDRTQVNVGLRTGKASGVLVLEVNQGEGALALEGRGEWRAECVAALGGSREQHYYALPPEGPWPASFFLAPQVMVYGEGGLVLAPPSLEWQSLKSWRWLKPPWESPPRPPGPAVWQFLQEYLPVAPLPATLEESMIPSWEEIFPRISGSEAVLQALLAPAASVEEYYQGLLAAALTAGLAEPLVLLGLLWHAPQGDARQRPERWQYLQSLVAQGAAYPGAWALRAGSGAAAGPAGREFQAAGKAGAGFDQSVAGQFFHLLAGLGERVITETCRYEGLRLEAGGTPAARTGAWNRRFLPNALGGEALAAELREDPLGLWEEEQQGRARYFLEVREATNDFLANHPDLSGDQAKVQMVLLCLKNYVNLDPQFAEMPVKMKLERAAQLARDFLEEMD